MIVSPMFIVFLFVYLVSFIVVVSFEEWFVIWVGLEMNLFMFLVLIYDRMSEDSVESAFSYFFIQSMGSVLLLVGMYMGYFVDMVLMMKVGMGPFFFWYLTVVKGIGWVENFFLMILQKILPFFLVSLVWGKMMLMVVLISMVLGMMGALLEASMSGLMAFSSLNHMGWILLSQMYGEVLWIEYIFFYGMFTYLLFYYLKEKKADKLIELQMVSKVMLVIFLISLSGMPPLVGFFLKVIILLKIVSMSVWMSMVMLITSLFMFYVYFRVIFKMLMSEGDVLISDNEKKEVSWLFLLEVVLFLVFLFL